MNLKVMFVGAGLLLLSFLHFTTNLPKTDCSAKKGRAQEQRWFIQKQAEVCTAHTDQEREQKTGKKLLHTFSLGSSHRWFDYFTED